MLFNGANTIYNTKLQNAKMVNVPYTALLNTTLNEKFSIEVINSTGTLDKYPELNLITIGCNVTELTNTSDITRINLTRSRHSPLDAALFNHVPFYLRTVADSVTNPPSKNLRLKKTITINNTTYIAYYGYKLTDIQYKDDILLYNGIKDEYVNVSKLDTNSSALLNPSPKPVTQLDIDRDVTYVTDFLKMYVYFTKDEVTEINNAMSTLYGTIYKISEIGVCNSIDMTLNDGTEEQVAVQIAYFMDVDIDTTTVNTDGSINFYLDVGGMEVLVV